MAFLGFQGIFLLIFSKQFLLKISIENFYRKFYFIIEKSNSNYLGIYTSLFLHLFILLFAIGLPDFFKPQPVTLPNIIPIEIINVTDTTSIPKELNQIKEKKNFETPQKKFDQTKKKKTKE